MSDTVGCMLDGCENAAAFMPIFKIPDGTGELVGVAFSLVVCAGCKISVTKEQILTPDGREQIEEAVLSKLGVTFDWLDAELTWDPVPQPGEGAGAQFEAHYRADDPEIAHIWQHATEVYNEFVHGPDDEDDNVTAARMTALGVVVLCEGYKSYRKIDEAGGQMFLVALMRSLGVQIEEQTGDEVKILVEVKTKDSSDAG